MTLRLTDAQDADLAALTKARGVSKQEAARQAITAAAAQERTRTRIADAVGRVQQRDAELLARLAE